MILSLRFKRLSRKYHLRSVGYAVFALAWVVALLFVLNYKLEVKPKTKVVKAGTSVACSIPQGYHALRASDRTDWQVVIPSVQELVSDTDLCSAVAKAIKLNEYFMDKQKSIREAQ